MIPNSYSSLVSLKCKFNNIRYISYRLYNLTYLDISNNKINKISNYYDKLIYLDISYTNINNIPESFINLKILKCYNTKIQYLPITLVKLLNIYPQYYKKYHINNYIKYIHNTKLPRSIKNYINNSIGVCSICLIELSSDIYKNISIIKNCNHHFHKTCLFEWFDTKLNCPNCRSAIFNK